MIENMTWEAFERKFPVQLNEQQKQAVRSVDGPVLLLAVPGSGKTTVLVTRLGYMIYCRGIAPQRILTVTYTVAATKDMARRFASYFGEELAGQLEFRTINGLCAKIIQYYSRSVGKSAFHLVQDEKVILKLLSEIYQEIEHDYPTESDLKNVRTLLTYIKNMMLTEEEIRELEEKEELKLLDIYRTYCTRMREEGLMDYDDQMIYAYNMLRRFPELLQHFQHMYPYICVDEAQDTSRIQHAIIKLLSSGREQLFMVGDEDQSIYGFRAAYPKALLSFEEDHPGAKILLMEENFRSNAKIVSAADRFIQKNTLRHKKHMKAAREAQKDITEVALRSRRAQYKYLLKVAENCNTQTAVLYRDHECAIPLIDLLERAGIPYRMRNAEVSFFTNRTVLDMIHIIQFALHPEDEELFLQIYYKIKTYLRKQDVLRIIAISKEKSLPILDAAMHYGNLAPHTRTSVKTIRTHLKHLQNDSAMQAVSRIINYMGYQDYLQRNEINDSKLETVKIIAELEDTAEDLVRRLQELKEIIQNKPFGEESSFLLSTIHASKGLEYDLVYMLDVTDGILPAQIPKSMYKASKEELETYEEERRLFYVGVTRAKQELKILTTNRKSSFCEEFLGKKKKADTSKQHNRSRQGTYQRANNTVYSAPQKPVSDFRGRAEKMKPGVKITHKKFGEGRILEIDEKNMQVQFQDKIRKLNISYTVANQLVTGE